MIFFLIILLLNEKAAEWQEYGAGQGWVKLAKLALWLITIASLIEPDPHIVHCQPCSSNNTVA